jgi:hypothetical protein
MTRAAGAQHDRRSERAEVHRESRDGDDEGHGDRVLVDRAREVHLVVDPDLDADDADEAVQGGRHAAEHARGHRESPRRSSGEGQQDRDAPATQ